MSGAGFLAGTTSPQAMTAKRLCALLPSSASRSAATLAEVVVEAMPTRMPAARASSMRRATPGRSGEPPLATSSA